MFTEYLQKLKNFDIMTPHIQLNIGGKSGVKTYFGVAMTVLYLISIAIFAYIILLTFLATDSPSVNEEQSQSKINPKVDMVENDLFPVSYLMLGVNILVPSDQISKYFTIFYNKFRVITIIDANGTPNLTLFTEQMPVIPCSQALKNATLAQVYSKYLNTEFFQNHGMAAGLCPQFDPQESYIAGGGSQNYIDVLNLEFYPCSLPDPTKCATIDELLNVGVVVTLPSSSVTLSNYANPVTTYLNTDVNYYVSQASAQRYILQLMYTEIWDTSQILFTSSLRSNFSSIEKSIFGVIGRDPNQLNCSNTTIFINSACIPYLEFQFNSGPTRRKFTRSYKTVTQALSQFGGINSMVMLVFVYINLIYNHYAKKTLLVGKVFKFFSNLKPLSTDDTKPGNSGGASNIRKGSSAELASPELDKSRLNRLGSNSPSTNSRVHHSLKNPLAHLTNKELDNLKDEAYQVIQKNLDVITLVREINNLKVLTHLLFKDYQKTLIPLISLNIQANHNRLKKEVVKQRRKINIRSGSKKSSFGLDGPPDARNPVQSPTHKPNVLDMEEIYNNNEPSAENREPGGTMSFNAALLMLEEYRNEIEMVATEDRTLDHRIALFCCEGLSTAAKMPELPSKAARSSRVEEPTASMGPSNRIQAQERQALKNNSEMRKIKVSSSSSQSQIPIQNFNPSEEAHGRLQTSGRKPRLLNV